MTPDTDVARTAAPRPLRGPRADQGTGTAAVHAALHPRSITVVGATDRPGSWGRRVITSLRSFDYPGRIDLVNPHRKELFGHVCFPDLGAVDAELDQVVVLTSASSAVPAVEEALRLGARSALVYAAGFEPDDGTSRALADELRACAAAGIALIGPNCAGYISAPGRAVTAVELHGLDRLDSSPVAVVAQSGGVAAHVANGLRDRGVRPRFVVSSGNEFGLTTADYLGYFTSSDVDTVLVYLETVADPAAFRRACQVAAEVGTRVLVLKAGQSDAGRRAAASHTGRLAGPVEMFDGLIAGTGAIRFDDLDRMIETAVVAQGTPHLTAPASVAVVGVSGAMAGLAADAASRAGVRLPPLSPETVTSLTGVLGVGSHVGNPLDTGFAGISDPGLYAEAVRAAGGQADVDMVLVQADATSPPALVTALARVREDLGKPVVLTPFLPNRRLFAHPLMADRHPQLTVASSVSLVMDAIGALAASASRDVVAGPSDPGTAPVAGRDLSEPEALELLRPTGIRSPRSWIVSSAREARAIAATARGSLVAKVVSRDLPHKSEHGGVVMGVDGPDQAEEAYARIVAAVAGSAPHATVAGVMFAEMVHGHLEVIVGGVRDPELGPMLMFGAGGLAVELGRDVAFAPVMTDALEARRLIARTRIGRLVLGEHRSLDLDGAAVAEALLGVSRLLTARADVLSLEVNPLAVLASGRGVVALDAAAVLA